MRTFASSLSRRLVTSIPALRREPITSSASPARLSALAPAAWKLK